MDRNGMRVRVIVRRSYAECDSWAQTVVCCAVMPRRRKDDLGDRLPEQNRACTQRYDSPGGNKKYKGQFIFVLISLRV